MKEHKNIEGVMKKLEEDNKLGQKKRKWVMPDPFFYPDARELFSNAQAITDFSEVEVSFC